MAVTLALRALGLGDLLTAVPALRALRAARPGHRLVLAAPEWLRPIVELSGAADELHPTPGLGALRWDRPPPDLAVNLHGRGPESIADLLAPRPRHLLTHRHPAHPELPGPDWPTGAHEVARWCRLLEWVGIPTTASDLDIPHPAETQYGDHVIVHPGASTGACRWPAERFATVAARLRRDGHRVLITGSATELDLARHVAEYAGLPPWSITAGRYSLRELAAAVAGAALVVCGDTGVGHLATALGTPSVLVFGPTPPSRWGPPPDRPRHRALWAGRIGDPLADTVDPGLLLITPDRVLAAIEAIDALAAKERLPG
ncbi:glycosyltransferase family 9 protein [Nocardia sp. CDC159]|uniref:Glycosyltransferase family 9 protein n=1 Tax=Nocardia pulmonis TaxID=2951408 RepID=A0A9X2IV69_9NOCA|nr:glycosyltransferase family 9 protein [Nocardia pulmonis]MCM6772119.1 glycosyltransferase family 9 protein [Nocardia pulmonis]MCM6785223.1 glycosyltransferase family 9 protein [Nocardia sp. CDC159]